MVILLAMCHVELYVGKPKKTKLEVETIELAYVPKVETTELAYVPKVEPTELAYVPEVETTELAYAPESQRLKLLNLLMLPKVRG